MLATLNGLYGDNLFDALVALRLPAVALESVQLESRSPCSAWRSKTPST